MHIFLDHGLHTKQLPFKCRLADCRRTKLYRLPDKNGLWLGNKWRKPTALKVANPKKPLTVLRISHISWALCKSVATVRLSTHTCQQGVVAGASRPKSPNVSSVFVPFLNVKSEHTFLSANSTGSLCIWSFVSV